MARNADRSSETVAFFIPNLSWGGAERMVVNLAGSLIDVGYSVDIVVCGRLPVGEGELAPPNGSRLIDLDVTKPILGVPGLVRYLRKEQPRVLVSTMTHVCIAGAIAGLATGRLRCICRQVNTLSRMLAGATGHNRWLDPLAARLLFPLGETVCVSRGVAEDLVEQLGRRAGRSTVIYEPALGQDFSTRLSDPVTHPWFAEGQPPVILAAGRFVRAKGFDVLLNAFGRLAQNTDARLLILGDGSLRRSFEEQVSTLGLSGRVDMPGFADNIPAYMSRCAVFVLPSRWEGMGVVVVEALKAGARVVATDCPHGPRELLGDGSYGELVPVEDVDALASALARALAAERGEMSPELDRWLKSFTPAVVGAHYRDMIDRMT